MEQGHGCWDGKGSLLREPEAEYEGQCRLSEDGPKAQGQLKGASKRPHTQQEYTTHEHKVVCGLGPKATTRQGQFLRVKGTSELCCLSQTL